MDGVTYALIVGLTLLVCWLSADRSRRPWSQRVSPQGKRQGNDPASAPVASRGTHLLNTFAHGVPGTAEPSLAWHPPSPRMAVGLGLEGPTDRTHAPFELERAPERDRASDLSQNFNGNDANDRALAQKDDPFFASASRSGVVSRATQPSGAPVVLLFWRRPAEGKKMLERGWTLEHVDPRYGTWFMRREETRW